MKVYPIGLIPGPTSVPAKIREIWNMDFGSSDLETEFFDLYTENQNLVCELLGAGNNTSVVITLGEAMSILWGGLKCALKSGDKLLAVASGLFGEGFSDMAQAIGVETEISSFPFDDIPDPNKVREVALRFRPNVITAVHCETPSGTLTPLSVLKELGQIAHEIDALFVVDFVSSGGATTVNVDDCGIDIGFLGSQKALSLPPTLSISTISERAWEVFSRVNYAGYDTYLPWREVPEKQFMPYTHDWFSMSALHVALTEIIRKEGMAATFTRHEQTAALCRKLGCEIGLELFPRDEKICSPTVTGFYVPNGWTWSKLNAELRKRGLAVGGNYGPLDGKVFRIGHMGSQANEALVTRGMNIIQEVLTNKK